MCTFSTNLCPLVHLNSTTLESTWTEGRFGWFAPWTFIFGKHKQASSQVAYLRPRLPPEGSISTFTIYIFMKHGLLRALECFFRTCQFLSHCFDYFQKTQSHPHIPYLTFRPRVLLLLFSIFIIALAIVKWQKLIHNFLV